MDVYCKSLFCYTDNINRKGGYLRGDQMIVVLMLQEYTHRLQNLFSKNE